jgi:hypothetical protein
MGGLFGLIDWQELILRIVPVALNRFLRSLRASMAILEEVEARKLVPREEVGIGVVFQSRPDLGESSFEESNNRLIDLVAFRIPHNLQGLSKGERVCVCCGGVAAGTHINQENSKEVDNNANIR